MEADETEEDKGKANSWEYCHYKEIIPIPNDLINTEIMNKILKKVYT